MQFLALFVLACVAPLLVEAQVSAECITKINQDISKSNDCFPANSPSKETSCPCVKNFVASFGPCAADTTVARLQEMKTYLRTVCGENNAPRSGFSSAMTVGAAAAGAAWWMA